MACNGISPTSPNATVASDDATALVDAKALKGPVPVPGSDCRDITEVKMRLLPSAEAVYLKVEAVYLKRGLPARCEVAPNWSSRPRGRLIGAERLVVAAQLRQARRTLLGRQPDQAVEQLR